MVKLYSFGQKIENFQELVGSFPAKEFDSPKRSTVLLLDYWRLFENRLSEFCEFFGEEPTSDSILHFEYRVPVQSGKGTASHTDLMISTDDVVFGIEAKYMEPPYEDVATWLGSSAQPNREAVLGGWLGLIESGTGYLLTLDQISGLAYQLIHRTASTFNVTASHRYVVYQVFDPSKHNYYKEQLGVMRKLLHGCEEISFGLFICPFTANREYSQILTDWEKGIRKMSTNVIGALSSESLCQFKGETCEIVA